MSDESENPISEAKLRANRENALKSTGPRTPEGKLKSSRNGVRHGILAEETFLLRKGESKKQWLRFRRRVLATLAPVSEVERFYADRAVWCMWRLRRVLNAERGAMEGENVNAKLIERRLTLLMQYEGALDRNLRRSLEMLAELKRARSRGAKEIKASDLGSLLIMDYQGSEPVKDAETESAEGKAGEGECRT